MQEACAEFIWTHMKQKKNLLFPRNVWTSESFSCFISDQQKVVSWQFESLSIEGMCEERKWVSTQIPDISRQSLSGFNCSIMDIISSKNKQLNKFTWALKSLMMETLPVTNFQSWLEGLLKVMSNPYSHNQTMTNLIRPTIRQRKLKHQLKLT